MVHAIVFPIRLHKGLLLSSPCVQSRVACIGASNIDTWTTVFQVTRSSSFGGNILGNLATRSTRCVLIQGVVFILSGSVVTRLLPIYNTRKKKTFNGWCNRIFHTIVVMWIRLYSPPPPSEWTGTWIPPLGSASVLASLDDATNTDEIEVEEVSSDEDNDNNGNSDELSSEDVLAVSDEEGNENMNVTQLQQQITQTNAKVQQLETKKARDAVEMQELKARVKALEEENAMLKQPKTSALEMSRRCDFKRMIRKSVHRDMLNCQLGAAAIAGMMPRN